MEENSRSGEPFTPARFLYLLERERRWCELLLTAIVTRRELRNLDVKLLADNTVAVALESRALTFRNHRWGE